MIGLAEETQFSSALERDDRSIDEHRHEFSSHAGSAGAVGGVSTLFRRVPASAIVAGSLGRRPLEHRIGGHVYQLVDHGLAVDEPHDAGLFG